MPLVASWMSCRGTCRRWECERATCLSSPWLESPFSSTDPLGLLLYGQRWTETPTPVLLVACLPTKVNNTDQLCSEHAQSTSSVPDAVPSLHGAITQHLTSILTAGL